MKKRKRNGKAIRTALLLTAWIVILPCRAPAQEVCAQTIVPTQMLVYEQASEAAVPAQMLMAEQASKAAVPAAPFISRDDIRPVRIDLPGIDFSKIDQEAEKEKLREALRALDEKGLSAEKIAGRLWAIINSRENREKIGKAFSQARDKVVELAETLTGKKGKKAGERTPEDDSSGNKRPESTLTDENPSGEKSPEEITSGEKPSKEESPEEMTSGEKTSEEITSGEKQEKDAGEAAKKEKEEGGSGGELDRIVQKITDDASEEISKAASRAADAAADAAAEKAKEVVSEEIDRTAESIKSSLQQ